MGLDGAEMIIEVEDEFGVGVDESHEGVMLTVGDLYQHIVAALRERDETPCPSSTIFFRLRRGLVNVSGVGRRDVRLDTRLDEIIPAPGRHAKWDRLRREHRLMLPSLVRPPLLAWGPAVSTVVLFAGAVVALQLWNSIVGFVSFLTGALAVAGVARLTQNMASRIPPGCETVEETVRLLADAHYGGDPAPKMSWSEPEVWEKLTSIIVEQLNVDPAKVTPDARFVADLGLS